MDRPLGQDLAGAEVIVPGEHPDALGRQPVIEVLQPWRAEQLREVLRSVHQVGGLEDRGVGDIFAEKQRVGELNDRSALAHHLADVGLRAELVGRKDGDVDAAVRMLLEIVGQRQHGGLHGVRRGQRMAEAEFELLRRGAASDEQRQRSDAKADGEAAPRGDQRHGEFLRGFVASPSFGAGAAGKLWPAF